MKCIVLFLMLLQFDSHVCGIDLAVADENPARAPMDQSAQAAKRAKKARRKKKKRAEKNSQEVRLCVICREELRSGARSIVELKCYPTHAMCLPCTTTYLLQPEKRLEPNCPVCRQEVDGFDYENEEVARLVSDYDDPDQDDDEGQEDDQGQEESRLRFGPCTVLTVAMFFVNTLYFLHNAWAAEQLARPYENGSSCCAAIQCLR